MSAATAELESVLEQLIAEHERLLRHLDMQQAAMKKLDLKQLQEHTAAQEAVRARIAALETRRRFMVAQMARAMGLTGQPGIADVASALPDARQRLLALRERIRELASQAAARAHVVARVAGAVLGHLNNAMRVLAGAIQQPGLYTRSGVPRMAQRIGVMEAVG